MKTPPAAAEGDRAASVLLKRGEGKTLSWKLFMLDRLRIIRIEQIIAFEAPSDVRLSHMMQEIDRDGRLRNPLLVQPMNGRYLMLDDATILPAIARLGLKHLPVQLADEKRLRVHPWQRIIEKIDGDDVRAFAAIFPRQIRITVNPSGPLRRHQAEIHFRDNSVWRLDFISASFDVRLDLSIKFLETFAKQGNSYRAKLDLKGADPLTVIKEGAAVLYPPLFSLEELEQIARGPILLPHGLVRVDQPGRILGVDFSLAILKDPAPTEEKQAFLIELLKMRMSNDRTGYYDGCVFVLNG